MTLMQVTTEEYEEMKEMFGKNLPNPEMYPKSFEYHYKVYRLFKYDRTFGGWKENIHYNE